MIPQNLKLRQGINYLRNNSDLIFVVPFRAGSKGLKDKNISDLNGTPLYVHTLNQAMSFRV